MDGYPLILVKLERQGGCKQALARPQHPGIAPVDSTRVRQVARAMNPMHLQQGRQGARRTWNNRLRWVSYGESRLGEIIQQLPTSRPVIVNPISLTLMSGLRRDLFLKNFQLRDFTFRPQATNPCFR